MYCQVHTASSSPGFPPSTPSPQSSQKSSKKGPNQAPTRAESAPLPCSPCGWSLLPGLQQSLLGPTLDIAARLKGQHIDLLLEGWRLLDWMELDRAVGETSFRLAQLYLTALSFAAKSPSASRVLDEVSSSC